ncbi:Uu.00g145050.m01.CDS01 [Anthostomella pinea]|uniref:Uu.00g145050.m01.CDS01 n=1 Tax=Anthostomella pinea TaxID=933095 RepID=A0AAI8VRS7_9PEZI|nr:Uu.00g145050.m01.CDS01 [Anthostomella pinea]
MIDPTKLPPDQQEALFNGPAIPPPDGTVPVFNHSPDDQTIVGRLTIACLVITSLAIGVRAYSKLHGVGKLRIEDYLVIGAFAAYIATCWNVFYMQSRVGFFIHQWDVRLRDMEPFIYFYCIPREKIWHPWLPGYRIDRRALEIVTAVFDFAFDLAIFLLPRKIIWNLHLSRPKKVGISLVFSVGVAFSGRVYAVLKIEFVGDTTYTGSPAFLWAISELTCGLLICCVPAAPKAFKESTLLAKISSTIQSWTSGSQGTGRDKSRGASLSWSGGDRKSAPSNVYQQILDDSHIPLTETTLSHPTAAYMAPGDFDPVDHQQGGILRTTEVITVEERGSMHLGNACASPHYAWAETS